MNEFPVCFHPIKQYRKKTWAEPKNLNKHNKVQYMTCYESLMSQIKKAYRFSRIVTNLTDNFDM